MKLFAFWKPSLALLSFLAVFISVVHYESVNSGLANQVRIKESINFFYEPNLDCQMWRHDMFDSIVLVHGSVPAGGHLSPACRHVADDGDHEDWGGEQGVLQWCQHVVVSCHGSSSCSPGTSIVQDLHSCFIYCPRILVYTRD